MPNALDNYLTAVQKFQECATMTMENLSKAREAYEGSIAASAEIHQILKSQDDALGSLMNKLEESVSFHLARRTDPRKVIETPVTEDLPTMLHELQESQSKKASGSESKKNNEEEKPIKKLWQL